MSGMQVWRERFWCRHNVLDYMICAVECHQQRIGADMSESETKLTASFLKKRSKTQKRLKERFLIRRNRAKRANFEESFFFKLRTLIQQKTVVRTTIQQKTVFCCIVVRSLKKKAFLENLHVLFCFV